jgi:hypothetical protein
MDNGCTLQLTSATDFVSFPPQYARILARSDDIGFTMNSDVLTGTFLRALSASKPAGRFLPFEHVGLLFYQPAARDSEGTSWSP